jgi:hypothetical protein
MFGQKSRLKIVKFMVEQYDFDGLEKGLSTKTMRKFPLPFCATQYNLIIIKAYRFLVNILEAMKKDKELYSI